MPTRNTPRNRGNESPLTEARMAAGLTQAQLAQLVGCSQKDISRWENGARNPSAARAVSLATILNLNIADMVNKKK